MDKWVSKQLKAQAREKAASCISDSDSETKVPEDEEVMARSREKQITSKEVPDRCDMCLVQSTRKGSMLIETYIFFWPGFLILFHLQEQYALFIQLLEAG